MTTHTVTISGYGSLPIEPERFESEPSARAHLIADLTDRSSTAKQQHVADAFDTAIAKLQPVDSVYVDGTTYTIGEAS